MKFVFLACLLTPILNASGQGDPLVQPDVIESSNGLLDMNLTLEYGNFSSTNFSFTNTRLFNGKFPGPTVLLNAGDTLRILFKNELELQQESVIGEHNKYTDPDASNLHFHGGHVSGEEPSDDPRLSINPGEEYQYETLFPSNHMPGTHWIHPHRHGSTSLQLGGGAAMALIVKDPDGFLPAQVESAEDIVLLAQSILPVVLQEVIDLVKDNKFVINFTEEGTDKFSLVNGQYQPTITMKPGEWQRWRIIWADWDAGILNAHFGDSAPCEMQLLAKDGIYIQDYPRLITSALVPHGGRADVMVRCSATGTYDFFHFKDEDEEILVTAEVSGSAISSTDLEPWTPEYPAYLADLTSTPATDGCACITDIMFCDNVSAGEFIFCVNNRTFHDDEYVHIIEVRM